MSLNISQSDTISDRSHRAQLLLVCVPTTMGFVKISWCPLQHFLLTRRNIQGWWRDEQSTGADTFNVFPWGTGWFKLKEIGSQPYRSLRWTSRRHRFLGFSVPRDWAIEWIWGITKLKSKSQPLFNSVKSHYVTGFETTVIEIEGNLDLR